MSRVLQLEKLITKAVIITCPNSRYDGMVGMVTDCYVDEWAGFELLYEIKLHHLLTRCKDTHTIVASKVDLAFEEFTLLETNFGEQHERF